MDQYNEGRTRYLQSLQLVQNMAHQKARQTAFLAYGAPSVALFIGLQNCIGSISSEKSIKESKNDIFAFVQRLGPEGEKYAITALMESLESAQAKDRSSLPIKSTLLTQIIKQYAALDNFMSYFPEILVKVGKQKLIQFTNNTLNNLKLPLNTQISIALSLYLSDQRQLMLIGENELVNKIKQFTNTEKNVKLPQKLLEELLFQINMNPQLSNKLDNQSKMLLETAEKIYKNSDTRIYNYIRDDWQFFANQTPVVEKPLPIQPKKADILRDLGPSITQQTDTVKAIISEIGTLNEEDIFQCLMMMAQEKTKNDSNLDRFVIDLMCASSTANAKKNMKNEDLKKIFMFDQSTKKTPVSWNIDNFLQYVTQNIQTTKWQNVMANLDRENLVFASDEHFVEIMKIFEKIKKLIKKWSISDSIILKKWDHPESQAEFLMRLYSCKDPDCLFFNDVQPTKKGQPNSKDTQSNLLREIWGYLELVTLFFEVSGFRKQKMKQVLEIPISKYPDILIKTLSQIKPAAGLDLLQETYLRILPQFLQYDSKSTKQIQMLWKNNKQLLTSSLNTIQKKQQSSKKSPSLDFDKLVQIFQQIQGSLQQLIMVSDYPLSLSLALISAKRDRLNIEKWVNKKIDINEGRFCKEMLTYFENNLFKQLRVDTQVDQRQNILEEAEFTIQTLNRIFSAIIDKLKQDYPNSKNNENFKKLHKECCKLIPELAQGQIYEQAQKQCEEEIKKIYKEQITIKDAVESLKKLKNSNKKQEMQNFANRISFLCTELTYHHSYPQKELMITAELFSALINENLVEKKIYQTFLHVIDEYLKEDNQQYTFALKVIENIKQKLAHESWFCEKLIENELVMRKNPQLVELIIKSIEPPKVLSVEKQRKIKQAIRIKNTPPQAFTRHMIMEPETHHHFTQIIHKQEVVDFDILATLDKSKKIDIPDRQAKLKVINTICNTLSLANVEEKAKQLKKALDNEKIIKLLAYRVLKMISITQNNGMEVFVKLLDNIPKAEKPIINMTYKILQNWFNLQGKSANNDKKFTHFKNLGSWLGRMTIGKGLPIPIYKLNIKDIIVKSFINNNRIAQNIPVVLKIMQFITFYPQIFRPQSPWLRRVLCALIELEQSLKQQVNIKSQIKAFFKTTKLDSQLENIIIGQPSLLANEKQITVNQMMQKINFGEDVVKICDSFDIKNIKMFAVSVLNSAILEIVQPVIDRAVKIAKTTTKVIVAKDFSKQSNLEKVRDSGITLARELSGPLAHVTCRQPLKTAITKKIREYIKQLKQSKPEMKIKEDDIQNLVQKILNQTLEHGCGIIKQKVGKSAQKAIKQDSEIEEGLEMRAYLKKNGGVFSNDTYINSIPAIVPQELRPSTGGLSEEQYGIYNELKKGSSRAIVAQTAQYPNLIDLLQLHEPLQKIKKSLLNLELTEQFLNRLHSLLLQQSNNVEQLEYYYQICNEIKDYTDQSLCWKLFKDVADLRYNEDHIKIMRKLVRDKYFEESVLLEIMEQEQKLMDLFQGWLKISEDGINQYVGSLDKKLVELQSTKKSFFYFSIKYILMKLASEHNQWSFNTIYMEQFILLAISCYNNSKQSSILLEQLIQSIIEALINLQPKYSASSGQSLQRPFFKILTNLIQRICHQKYKNNADKITIFGCIVGKKINRINPLVKPNFSFAWLQLICNKYLMKCLLQNYQNWDIYYNLLASLLKFMNQTITQIRLNSKNDASAYRMFYQAVLKLIVVLIHDFSSFLSAFSLELCLMADNRFIQLKNIINSAFPANQLQIPLKFDKREDLEQFVEKVGYPKYYKLNFDKPRLNYYLNGDSSQQVYKDKLAQQDDLFLQILVLYYSWLQQNSLTQALSTKRLTELLCNSKDEMRSKLINNIINLIRYPNYITLYFIDFVTHIIFKQNKDNSLKEQILANIITRMRGEVPIAWGLIYLVNFVLQKKDLQSLNISQELLDQF